MVLVQKQPFFRLFFQAKYATKMSFMIFQNEKTFFQALKTRTSKTRKIDIFAMGLTHGFGAKMAIFPTFFFAIQARKMSFMIFQNKKTLFYSIKTRGSKSRKIDIFLKALTHGFGPRMAIFPTFFLGNIAQENVCYDILEPKTPFQAIKTRSPKRRKIDIFPKKLIHGFGPKMTILSSFFFRQ